MKIEPRNTAKIPKYAAVLAAAVMLTGCGYDEEPGFEGTAPADSYPEVELMGEAIPEQFTEPAQTAVPDETATETVTTAVTDEPLMLDGDVDMPDGVTDVYDGDRVCTEPAQTFTTVPERQPELAGLVQVTPHTHPGVPVFEPTAGTSAAEQEEILSRWQDACSARGWSFKVSAERAKWFGTGFQRVLSIDDPALMILLYDGSAADSTGLTMREWADGQSSELFDWGCIMPKRDSRGDIVSKRTAAVDISVSPDPAKVFEDAGL